MNRRHFLQSSVAILAMGSNSELKAASDPSKWTIGCFNRPWSRSTFAETLQEIKSAGYETAGLISRTKEDPFIAAESSPEYIAKVKETISRSGIAINMAAIRSRHDIAIDESIRDVRKQIDNASRLGVKNVMSFGVDSPKEFENYLKVMSDAAAYAAEKEIKLVMKPHGGISAASAEMLEVIRKINHRNFSIWYDAGNIIHYSGKDPVAEIEPIAKHISGFCAKDCLQQRGDVMIQFGSGKVNFSAVFKKLQEIGFNGPIMVECCKVGKTEAETTRNARANREYLQKVIATL